MRAPVLIPILWIFTLMALAYARYRQIAWAANGLTILSALFMVWFFARGAWDRWRQSSRRP